MSNEYFEKMKKSIEEADKVLIGIGNEMEADFETLKKERGINSSADDWQESYLRKMIMDSADTLPQDKAYQNLKKLLEGKDYYIISLAMDDAVYRVFEREDNVVTPCGGLYELQCEAACTPMLYPVKDVAAECLNKMKTGEWSETDCPVCPMCGKKLIFNNLYAENYVEEGYLEKFAEYKKWLQSTVNKKLCIVELGASMRFPSIIRFAFDKLAYYNLKSEFYRVHETLYQHTSENKERGISVPLNSLEFMGFYVN